MTYCDNRALREELYRAYPPAPGSGAERARDNTPVMEEILALRVTNWHNCWASKATPLETPG